MADDNIEHVHSSPTQTLLHVYATLHAVRAALGAEDPAVIDVDKSWHGWEVTTVHGQVDVYDWGRQYAEDISEDAPALPADAVACWHVNATGPGHAAGALEMARRLTAPGAPAWPYTEFIGRRVEAVLDRGPVFTTVQVGRLLATSDDGEFQIEDDNGVIHFCWPLLDIREVATCDVPYTGSNWHAERCERGPGHEHCDRYGRTW